MRNPAPTQYEECTGCNLCLLPCPVWRRTKDPMLSMCGRIGALSAGASSLDLKESIMACVLCGACEPACPIDIDTIGMMLDLRKQLAEQNGSPLADRLASSELLSSGEGTSTTGCGAAVFLPGASLRANGPLFTQSVSLLERASAISTAVDDGTDMAATLEAGRPLAPDRQERFVLSLTGAKEIIATEGLLHRFLRQWLPGVRITGLGEALLRIAAIRKALLPTDMYVIETRCYHADHKRLVDFYDEIRRATGCTMNVDTACIAIPTTAGSLQNRFGLNAVDPPDQTKWILHGRKIDRIVVENLCDSESFEKVSQLPVIHISELADREARV